MDTMNIFQELKARGFCYQQTDEEAIEKLLSTERVKFYVGFDPTGNSLHVGHLLPVMAMRLMQKAGHIPDRAGRRRDPPVSGTPPARRVRGR